MALMAEITSDDVPVVADDDVVLNEMLGGWHRWASDERTALGYPTRSASAMQYRASRQYDDANGALDQHVDNVVMAGIDGCINSIPQPFRNALHINARNIATGVAVWESPRLPTNELARQFMVFDAREMLFKLLRKRGLL